MIYFFYLFFLLILSFNYDIIGKTKYKKFWYNLTLFIAILIAGLRYRLGVDTIQYLDWFYNEVPYIDDFFSANEKMLYEPLYYLINSLIKTIGCKFYVVQIIQATIVNVLIFRYIERHSCYIFMCVTFYFVWLFFSFTMEEMRASISVAICLFGNDYFLEKKWLKGIFLYIIGFLFHNSTIIIFITPLFMFIKLNIWGILMLMAIPIMGMVLQDDIANYLFLMNTEDQMLVKAEIYLNNDDYLVKHNIFYYLFDVGILFFYSILSIISLRNGRNKILKYQLLLFIGLIFVILQSNLGILYRIVNFYSIYFILFFVELFMSILKNAKFLDIKLAYLRSVIFFIPFFIFVSTKYFIDYKRYYPYSSVFDREVDYDRENLYHKYRSDVSLIIRENQY